MRGRRIPCGVLGLFLVTASCTSHDTASGALGTGTDSTHLPTPPTASAHDWTRFGWNAARTSVSTDSTGITAANVQSLSLQKVSIDGTVDGSAIYLHGVQVGGATHNVFFVTTTYGKTLAIDADSGADPMALHAARLQLLRRQLSHHHRNAGRGARSAIDLRGIARRIHPQLERRRRPRPVDDVDHHAADA